MPQLTDTHKHMMSYGNALLSLWLSCKSNKINPLRSDCFCSLLPRVRLSWKTGISIYSLLSCILWGIKHTFRCYMIHWWVQVWGQTQMSGNLLNDLKERKRKDEDWEWTCAKSVFWSTATDKDMRCHKYHHQKRNSVDKMFGFEKLSIPKVLIPSTVPVKPEKVALKCQKFWDNHWKHIPCVSTASKAEYPHSLLCSLSLSFFQVNLDISHADSSNKNLAWTTFVLLTSKAWGRFTWE